MSGKQKYQLEDQIKRYLQDQMTGQERHAFEREMQHDQFLAEAVEGYSGISPDFVGTDLAYLKKRIKKRQKVNRKYIWYAAASIIILVISSLLLFNIEENSIQMVAENKVQQKAAQKEEIRTGRKEIVDTEHEGIKKPLSEKNLNVPEDEMVITDSEAITPYKAANEGNPPTSLLPEQSRLKESIQLHGNKGLTKATKTLDDSSALAINEADTSKKPIRIRGISTLNENVISQEEYKLQTDKEEIEKIKKSSVHAEKAMDEVVVVGYGKQKKAASTGAVAELPTNQIDDVAGVNVNQNFDVNVSPVIGWIAFKKYLKTALLTPKIGLPEEKIVVRLSFVITKTGTIDQIKVLSGKNGRYTEEAIRILLDGPKWNPEVKSQEPQRSVVKLRMVFQPSDKKNVK